MDLMENLSAFERTMAAAGITDALVNDIAQMDTSPHASANRTTSELILRDDPFLSNALDLVTKNKDILRRGKP